MVRIQVRWFVAKTTAAQLTNIGDTEQYFNEIIKVDMSKIAHVQVRLTFPVGAKEIATISIYTTLDDNNFLWDTEGVQSFSVTPGHNPNFVSFSLKDKYRCRIGVKATATMVLPTADMSYLLG